MAMLSKPICLIYEVDGLIWQGYLAGTSKTAPRILFFSIVISADSSPELLFMPTWVLAFCAHNNLFLGRVIPTRLLISRDYRLSPRLFSSTEYSFMIQFCIQTVCLTCIKHIHMVNVSLNYDHQMLYIQISVIRSILCINYTFDFRFVIEFLYENFNTYSIRLMVVQVHSLKNRNIILKKILMS